MDNLTLFGGAGTPGTRGPAHTQETDEKNPLGMILTRHNETYHLDAPPNLTPSLPLQHPHEQQKCHRVEQRADCDTIDKPLGHRVPPIEPALARGVAVAPVVLALVLRLLEQAAVAALGELEGLVAGGGREAPREGALEPALPEEVGGRGDDAYEEEAEELGDVEGEGELSVWGVCALACGARVKWLSW